MIRELINPLLVPKLLDMAKVVPEVNISALQQMLFQALHNNEAKIYFHEKDEDVLGFIFGSIEYWQGEEVLFIQFSAVKPIKEEKYIGFELLTRIRLWAKEKGLKKIVMVTMRNPKPFIRKYKFKMAGYILTKEVVDVRPV